MADQEDTNPENEEKRLKHRMDFIVEQQALLIEADARIKAQQESAAQQLIGLTEAMSGLATIVAGLAKESAGVLKMIGELSRIVERHEKKLYG